jgi:hypothetical protein
VGRGLISGGLNRFYGQVTKRTRNTGTDRQLMLSSSADGPYDSDLAGGPHERDRQLNQ